MRRRVALVCLVAVMALVAAACHPESDYVHGCPPSGSGEKYLIDLVRNYRAEHGIHDVYCNLYAQSHADQWSNTMRDAGRASHSTLELYYPSSQEWGHRYACFLGENVGVNYWDGSSGFRNAALEGVFEAWLESESHRNIIRHGAFEWIGAGYAHRSGTPGKVYVALEMGTRDGSPRCGLVNQSAQSFSAGDASASEGLTVVP